MIEMFTFKGPLLSTCEVAAVVVLRMEDLLTDFFLGMLLAADVAVCWGFGGGGTAEDDATGTSAVAQGIVQVMLSSSSILPSTPSTVCQVRTRDNFYFAHFFSVEMQRNSK